MPPASGTRSAGAADAASPGRSSRSSPSPVLYTVIQVTLVRPYLWPAGTGATLAGDPTAHLPLKARPPNVVKDFISAPEITRVAPGSPADAAGIVAGDRLRAEHRADGSRTA